MKKLFNYLHIGLNLLIMIAVVAMNNISLKTSYIIYALYIFSLIAFVLEMIIFKMKKVPQLIISIIGFVLGSMLYTSSSDIVNNDFPNYALASTIFALVSAVLVIVDIVFTYADIWKRKKLINQQDYTQVNIPDSSHNLDNNNPSNTVQPASAPKYYPIGHLSKYQSLALYGLTVLLILLAIGAVYLIYAFNVWYVVPLFMLVIFLLFYAYVIVFNRVLLKPFRHYMNTLDFAALETDFLKIFQNEKIHPETRNYYLMLFITFANSVDKKKSEQYLPFFFAPKIAAYQLEYDLFILDLAQKDEWNDVYQTLLKKYSNNKRLLKSLHLLNTAEEITNHGKCDVDIDALFPLKAKTKQEEATHLYVRVFYFYNQKNPCWMKDRDQFKEKYPSLLEMIKKLDNLDSNETIDE